MRNSNILSLFRNSKELPKNYGLGIDERVVEYPWVFAHLGQAESKILDAGSTFNYESIVTNKVILNKDLTIFTLDKEPKNFPRGNINYVYGDLRSMLFKDSSFDTVVCISTLEHVGMDNSIYSGDAKFNQNQEEDYLLAVREMHRALRPGGQLLLTVPYGKRISYGFFQQFDDDMIRKVGHEFGSNSFSPDYYKLLASGWAKSSKEQCSDVEYGKKVVTKMGNTISTAQAVACIKLIK